MCGNIGTFLLPTSQPFRRTVEVADLQCRKKVDGEYTFPALIDQRPNRPIMLIVS